MKMLLTAMFLIGVLTSWAQPGSYRNHFRVHILHQEHDSTNLKIELVTSDSVFTWPPTGSYPMILGFTSISMHYGPIVQIRAVDLISKDTMFLYLLAPHMDDRFELDLPFLHGSYTFTETVPSLKLFKYSSDSARCLQALRYSKLKKDKYGNIIFLRAELVNSMVSLRTEENVKIVQQEPRNGYVLHHLKYSQKKPVKIAVDEKEKQTPRVKNSGKRKANSQDKKTKDKYPQGYSSVHKQRWIFRDKKITHQEGGKTTIQKRNGGSKRSNDKKETTTTLYPNSKKKKKTIIRYYSFPRTFETVHGFDIKRRVPKVKSEKTVIWDENGKKTIDLKVFEK